MIKPNDLQVAREGGLNLLTIADRFPDPRPTLYRDMNETRCGADSSNSFIEKYL